MTYWIWKNKRTADHTVGNQIWVVSGGLTYYTVWSKKFQHEKRNNEEMNFQHSWKLQVHTSFFLSSLKENQCQSAHKFTPLSLREAHSWHSVEIHLLHLFSVLQLNSLIRKSNWVSQKIFLSSYCVQSYFLDYVIFPFDAEAAITV